jgi:hypothetical protein
MLTFPIIGIAVTVLLCYYMRNIYRQAVSEVNEENKENLADIKEYNSLNYDQETAIDWNKHNQYIKDANEKPVSGYKPVFNMHIHLMNRSPSFYDDLILLGGSGFYVLLNIIQTIACSFIIWMTILILKHVTYMVNQYSGYILFAVIPIMILYLLINVFLFALTMKWYTIITSVYIF